MTANRAIRLRRGNKIQGSDLDHLDDIELVRRALNDDRRAFDGLVQRHYDIMFRMAYKWSGNRDAAADITHNAFLKMAANLHRFRGGSAFRTWLCRIVINTAKDWTKSQRHYQAFEIFEEQDHSQVSAVDKIYASEVLRGVYALPEKERDAVLLVFWEGFSHAEAGKILGCMEKTVSWRIHSARKKLAWLGQGRS